MTHLEIESPGILAHVQDGGRVGRLAQGIAPAGAQDFFALRLANLLVGNAPTPAPLSSRDPGAAGLEMTGQGVTVRFRDDRVVAVTGAVAEVTVNGHRRPRNAPMSVRAGDVLAVGVFTEGVRGYLAVSGGIDVEPYLGSRSTHLFAKLGGFEGRALQAGDSLPLGVDHGAAPFGSRASDEASAHSLERTRLRVVLGPQTELFTEESVADFLDGEWELGALNSRMGFRFTGPALSFLPRPDYVARAAGADPSNIVDDIIPIGGIQCPSGAEAIVMGVENPTVGGFAKIATVISADLGRLGQLSAGERVRFVAVSIEQADEALDRLLETDHLVPVRAPVPERTPQ